MPPLSNPKHEAFALHWATGSTAEQATIAAGYTPKTARSYAVTLRAYPSIIARVREIREAVAVQLTLDSAQLLQDWIEEKNADITEITHPDGTYKPLNEWPRHWRRMIQQYETPDLMEHSKDGGQKSWDKIGRMIKIRFKDRNRIDEMIGRHKAIDAFVQTKQETHNHLHISGQIDQAISEGRQRAAQRYIGSGRTEGSVEPSAEMKGNEVPEESAG